MKEVTLLFLLKPAEKHILLAMKKRGFGMNRWNGVGGKLEAGETVEQATIRECQEEIGVTPTHLQKVAHLTFFPQTLKTHQGKILAHTYISHQWEGEPIETEEMAPQWFRYNDMWDDDQYWLPAVLAGSPIVAEIHLDGTDTVTHKKITIVTPDHALLQ